MLTRSRALIARFLPPGAILLGVLTFAAYAAGLVRDRIFARTYGAGPELDAYNAAFVLPELAARRARRERPDRPVRAGLHDARPGQTPARGPGSRRPCSRSPSGVTSAMSLLLLFAAPSTIALIAPGFDAENQARYLDLFRLMLVTPIVFAASITLGEVLVAERRFLYYALAPILYNVGIVAGTVLFHDTLGISAAAVGAVIGSFLHLGIRAGRDPPHIGAGPAPARPADARPATSSCG